MRRQVEFYSSMQDVKRCSSARALFIQVYIGVPFPFPTKTERENACMREHKPTHTSEVRASVVVQMVIAILPEQSLSLSTDFLHLQLHAIVDHQLLGSRCTYGPFWLLTE
ncbi:hypothetical protein AVEN_98508-1 [Araneus ventricosus]|uniref:Uncharacterized protein n=1 Tax=Araneus ventricosus TaxID=182803 RepID=A0A4Y2ERE5_ARAVE|nr:hypothetical protein AVEN_98508-1 [Araneus ventricosus]